MDIFMAFKGFFKQLLQVKIVNPWSKYVFEAFLGVLKRLKPFLSVLYPNELSVDCTQSGYKANKVNRSLL